MGGRGSAMSQEGSEPKQVFAREYQVSHRESRTSGYPLDEEMTE